MLNALLLFCSLSGPLTESDSLKFQTPQEIIELADQLQSEEKYDEAIQLLTSISESDTSFYQAQSELMTVYNFSENYDKCIEMGEKLKDVKSSFRRNIYIQYGNGYINKMEWSTAKEIFEEAALLYPYDHVILYNLGYVNYRLRNFEEALKILQRSAYINPFYSRNHVLLGYISAIQGHRTKALLSYLTYMAISPSDNGILVFINNLAGDAFRQEGSIPELNSNEDFERIDQLLRSRAAMDNRFQMQVEFNADLVKQTELMLSRLVDVAPSEDFWNQFYVPFYSEIQKQGYTPAFIYFILQSVKSDEVKQWLAKNEDQKSVWVKIVNSAMKENRKTLSTTVDGQEAEYSFWYYDNNLLSAIGNQKTDEHRLGAWEFYYVNGELSGKGSYNDNGKKTGRWEYFHNNTVLSRVEVYDQDGNYIEPVVFYNEDGSKRLEINYEGTVLNGEVVYFYECGNIKEKLEYRNDERNGKGNYYWKTGEVQISYAYENDKLTGPYNIYHKNGNISQEYIYADGKLSGEYKSYYLGGELNESGTYQEDESHGDWVGSYASGTKRFMGTYDKGDRIGAWKFYHKDGSIMEDSNYKEGKLHGESISYRLDGSIESVTTYNEGKVVGLKCYDSKNTLLFDESNDSGNLQYKIYFGSGELYSEGTFQDGQLNGPYKIYYRNGQVKETSTMLNNEADGEYIEYFDNGRLKLHIFMKEGKNHGSFKKFFPNGKIEEEGWYVEGNTEKEWKIYYPDGSLNTEIYFITDNRHGIEHTYGINQTLSRSIKYDMGSLMKTIQYDSLGKAYNEFEIDSTGGMKIVYKSANGMNTYTADYQCGEYLSDAVSFFSDGKKRLVYEYEKGLIHGSYLSYHRDGSLEAEGNYQYGEMTGDWTWYFENGKPTQIQQYKEDQRHGKRKRYYPNGILESDCEYYNGELMGTCEFFDQEGNLQVKKISKQNTGLIAFVTPKNDTIAFEPTKDMKYEAFFDNGKPSFSASFKNGLKDGLTIYYNKSGAITEEINYGEGMLQGIWTKYYPNGQIYEITNYIDDRTEGVEKEYYESGKIKRTTEYKFDEKNGYEILYDESGSVISKIYFRNGDIY